MVAGILADFLGWLALPWCVTGIAVGAATAAGPTAWRRAVAFRLGGAVLLLAGLMIATGVRAPIPATHHGRASHPRKSASMPATTPATAPSGESTATAAYPASANTMAPPTRTWNVPAMGPGRWPLLADGDACPRSRSVSCCVVREIRGSAGSTNVDPAL
ncbi:MAG: hypothetical protein EBS89_11575 [Proteobacteria bacterium]|nr:hypothetical protein [Pseudomonadota bacterium]